MLAQVLSFQKEGSLSMIQLSTSDQNTFNYISGATAIKQDLVQVKEVSEQGSVNNLVVFNLSDDFIFFSDGDILQGAKQNRVLNTSVLLAPHTKVNLPVSCVEQGRWFHKSPKFRESGYSAPTDLRAMKALHVKKNLEKRENFMAEQGAVWSKVNEYSSSLGVASPTANLSDIFDNKELLFDEFVNKFKHKGGANGIAIFIKNNLVNIDVFNKTDIFSEYFSKLLKGSAMEAFRLKDDKNGINEAEAKYKVLTFLDKLEEIHFETYKGVGVGNEKRFETKDMTGFELNYENKMIHLTALNLVSFRRQNL